MDLTGFLREPSPVIITRSPKGGHRRRPDQVSTSSGPVTRFRNGTGIITRPKHGDTGWCHEESLVYNANHGPLEGWYKIRDYQVLKAIQTETPDWRVMPEHFYRGQEFAMLPPVLPTIEVFTSKIKTSVTYRHDHTRRINTGRAGFR
jgi:hypothetical protein